MFYLIKKILLIATAGVETKAYVRPGGNWEEQRKIRSVLQLYSTGLCWEFCRSHHFRELPGSIPTPCKLFCCYFHLMRKVTREILWFPIRINPAFVLLTSVRVAGWCEQLHFLLFRPSSHHCSHIECTTNTGHSKHWMNISYLDTEAKHT